MPPKYIMTMEPAPENIQYWADGIEKTAKGNDNMGQSSANGWTGDHKTLGTERNAFIENMKNEHVPLVVIPHPLRAWMDENGVNEDMEYIRDPLIVSPTSQEALVFNMGEETRQKEGIFHKRLMQVLGVPTVEQNASTLSEGGNIRRYTIDDRQMYFAATSVRSNPDGVNLTADFLKIDKNNRVILELQTGFHLDCAMTAIITEDTKIIFVVPYAFTSESRKKIDHIAREMGLDLHLLEPHPETCMATNQLTYQNHSALKVFASEPFPDARAQNRIQNIPGLVLKTSPLTQNSATGGANHCLAQELWTKEPLDPNQVNVRLKSEMADVFPPDADIKIFNNY